MATKKRNDLLAILIAIVGIVCAIIAFIFHGVLGLVVSVGLSLVIFGCYCLYLYYSTYRWKRKSNVLFNGIVQPEFLEWQQAVLEQIYADLELVSIYGRRYPAAILRPEKCVEYPFDGLCKLKSTNLPEYEFDKKQEQYLKILGESLRAPKMKGYALSRINYTPNGHTETFDAVTIRQEQNLATCHILEWELFEYYRQQMRGKLHGIISDNILEYLPYRARYHSSRSGKAAISAPHEAYPLISVQAMVIFKDTRGAGNPVWRAVLAKRSEKVIIRRGFFQFEPAGSFEVYGRQCDENDYLVQQGFDIGNALLREYAEELFDVEEFQENTKGRDPNSIRSHPDVRRLIHAIKKPSPTAWFEFIGTIFDLTVLRPELSFLILIEDEFFCESSILGNWESNNIMSPGLEELPSILSNNDNLVHGSSAGILQLAIGNKQLQKLGIAIPN